MSKHLLIASASSLEQLLETIRKHYGGYENGGWLIGVHGDGTITINDKTMSGVCWDKRGNRYRFLLGKASR